MINNRYITISTGNSRREIRWQSQALWLSELYDRLRTPLRGTETLADYLRLPKPQQDDRKDVGGFVAGVLTGPRRKAGAVACREVITLDLDSIPPGGKDDALRRVEGLGCGYCVYSTRKHSSAAPRLRVLIPLDRPASADEYEAIARMLASIIGMEWADPTTFEPHRLMFWPSCCADSEYVFVTSDKPLASADGVLALYADWRDHTQWPQHAGAPSPVKLAVKQGDPEAKQGVVGAFCRCYDVEAAMLEFLPGLYDPVDTTPGRYTYTGGSTTGGAVLYDNGKFLFSHHATDPCGGKLVNAFDLVRLHKFSDLDDDADPRTPTGRLPSYDAMLRLATADKATASLLAKERRESAVADFADIAAAAEPAEDPDWQEKLMKHPKTGIPLATIDNVWVILEYDPLLRGKFALNEFSGRGEVLGAVPWDTSVDRRAWDDSDIAGLYWYLEKVYSISSNGKVDNAMGLHSKRHKFNEVTAYLDGLAWDGVPRLDRIFIDYLGAADTPYNRAVARKIFVAAVARAKRPGIKFDNMVVLGSQGQGIGKSSLLAKMFGKWFTDAISTFEGKEMGELLQGVWGVEVAELDALRRTDVSRVKLALSMLVDRFRAAYGRTVKEFPRRCVFFGTTNESAYLVDRTGNRRFWPVDCGMIQRERFRKVVPNTLRDGRVTLDSERDQLWAEAVHYWRLGEPLELEGAIAAQAQQEQESHREVSSREGLILEFIKREVPEGWNTWTLDRRRNYWAGCAVGEIITVPRDRVCALEMWCELFGGQLRDIKYTDSAEINAVVLATKQWGKPKPGKFGYCGMQRGFFKENPVTSGYTADVNAGYT